MLISTIAALSTFYPEANPALRGNDIFKNPRVRNKQIFRIIGKLPTLAAAVRFPVLFGLRSYLIGISPPNRQALQPAEFKPWLHRELLVHDGFA